MATKEEYIAHARMQEIAKKLYSNWEITKKRLDDIIYKYPVIKITNE